MALVLSWTAASRCPASVSPPRHEAGCGVSAGGVPMSRACGNVVLVSAYPDPSRLRNLAAILSTVSGAGQCFALWLLPTTPMLLLSAWIGTLYLFLALGLFGNSRLSLFLAVSLPPLRAWLAVEPLPIDAWEFLRTACDLAIAALCLSALWAGTGPAPEAMAAGRRGERPHDKAGDDA